MKCSNCIAYGRDRISPLCIAGFSKEPTKGIQTLPNGEYGCTMHKKTIIRRTKMAMEDYPDRFTQFRTEFRRG